jgi:hypothetical protein
MSRDRAAKQAGEGIDAANKHNRGRKKSKHNAEELSPERRQELARQIEAKRFRGKPPSI